MTWDAACLEEVCGSCTMNINGKVRMACSALIDKLEQPITLEPMRKFPLVRDLAVDRTRMFEALKRVKAWIQLDGTHNLGPGPRQSPERPGGALRALHLHDLRLLPRGVPQITAGQRLHRRRGHQPGPAVQHAPHRAR